MMVNTPRNKNSTSSAHRGGTKGFLTHGSAKVNHYPSSPSTPVVMPVQAPHLPCFEPQAKHHSPSDVSPSASIPTVHHQSRLPPNTVARKAPRKATFITTRTMHGPPKITKPTPKNTRKLHTVDELEQTAAQSKAYKSFKEATPPPECNLPPSGTLGALMSEARKRRATGTESQTPSTSFHRTDNTSASYATRAIQTAAQHIVTIPRAQHSQHPQPRFEYSLTPQLKSIKRALGPDSWTDYLVLIEQHELAEITDREYQVQECRLFQVPSVKLRRLIRKLVVEQMTDPDATE